VLDIIEKLDKDVYNRQEINANYAALAEKWGEWTVIGGEHGGIGVTFIDIKRAFFSGGFWTFGILAAVFVILDIVITKITMPKLAKHYDECNKEMVDLTTLEMAEHVKKIKEEKREVY
jgi:uncharacterized membrane protein (DUF485 family)